jgi:sterol desaturase/sphingolipid hydroxylase (fatty acid hydroxylase superfamily)
MSAFFDQPRIWALLNSVVYHSTWLLLLMLIFLPIERLFSLHPRKFLRQSTLGDIGFYFVSGLIPSMLLAIPLSLLALAAHQIVPSSLHMAVAALPLWLRVVAGVVVGEIGFYWAHRWAHEIPFLWRFHSIHHGPEELYFLISSRAHPFDNAFMRIVGLTPVFLLGLANPLTPSGNLVPTLIVLISIVWGFFIHSNLRWRLGPLEWIISSPAFHHWHHTLAEPRDRNYAAMLPWIDRIFGTYHLPRKQWPSAYGIDAELPSSVAGQLLHPLLPRPARTIPAPHPVATTDNGRT